MRVLLLGLWLMLVALPAVAATGLDETAVRVRLDEARLLLRRGEPVAAAAALAPVGPALAELPLDADTLLDRLARLRLGMELAKTGHADPAAIQSGLQEASAAARAIGDGRLAGWALLYLGEIEADAGRQSEALGLWRQGMLAAAAAPDPLYRLQQQAGRMLAALGDRPRAIRAYEGAVRTLASIRLDLPTFDPLTGRSLFREVVGPVFLELADLRLQEAAASPDPEAAQALLKAARLEVETLKAVELEDYFEDDCVADLQARIRPVDRPGAETAVLYPIILPDRLELLLSLPDGRVAQAQSPVGEAALTETVRRFRLDLENRAHRRFLGPARTLDGWLIQPIRALLESSDVRTLVVVPDGPLRTIPFAALHDGSHFLAERLALATAPGLSLLDPRPLAEVRPVLLLGGLTEAVQGFPALPNVAGEIDAIHGELGGTVLLDRSFVLPAVQRSLERVPFTIVHIASHGEFKGDPKESFLLTYDGRLDMDGLERLVRQSRFREQPVELLTLSACRTAAGDDRAALGLAGIAIKAGARSALASLWFINDQSSALLVERFYQALVRPGTSKAEALRRAQLDLMADRRFAHPAYWAPFLVIGNWL